jgi:hypothetical protein
VEVRFNENYEVEDMAFALFPLLVLVELSG